MLNIKNTQSNDFLETFNDSHFLDFYFKTKNENETENEFYYLNIINNFKDRIVINSISFQIENPELKDAVYNYNKMLKLLLNDIFIFYKKVVLFKNAQNKHTFEIETFREIETLNNRLTYFYNLETYLLDIKEIQAYKLKKYYLSNFKKLLSLLDNCNIKILKSPIGEPIQTILKNFEVTNDLKLINEPPPEFNTKNLINYFLEFLKPDFSNIENVYNELLKLYAPDTINTTQKTFIDSINFDSINIENKNLASKLSEYLGKKISKIEWFNIDYYNRYLSIKDLGRDKLFTYIPKIYKQKDIYNLIDRLNKDKNIYYYIFDKLETKDEKRTIHSHFLVILELLENNTTLKDLKEIALDLINEINNHYNDFKTKNETKNETLENPYNDIFKNGTYYKMFLEYSNKHIIDAYTDYSYLKKRMQRNKFIFNIKDNEFYDFLINKMNVKEKRFIEIYTKENKFKSEGKSNNENRNNNYNNIFKIE